MSLSTTNDRWTVHADRPVTYTVRMHQGLLDHPDPEQLVRTERPVRRRLWFTDITVQQFYGKQLDAWLGRLAGENRVAIMDTTEHTKDRAAVESVYDAVIQHDLNKGDELGVIGGGVPMDIVGTGAAWLWKGYAPYVAIPTTLVGLVDAGVGAKRAINFDGRKSYEGAYYPARLTLIDPAFLATLDPRHLRAGCAEVLKVAATVDPELYALLDAHAEELIADRFAGDVGADVVRRAIHGILEQLADDLYESDLRRWPDYGHTIGPTLESESDWTLLHGETVAICGAVSATIAKQRGLLDDTVLDHLLDLTERMGLPVWHRRLNERAFLERAVSDAVARRGGHQHWPVPVCVGGVTFLEDVAVSEVEQAVRALRDRRAVAK